MLARRQNSEMWWGHDRSGTAVCSEMAALAIGADVLVYEAMRSDEIRKRPAHLHYIIDYHANTREIGQQAAALDIPLLMLTHLIPEPYSEADKKRFSDEVREGGYQGHLVVCDDLTSVTLGEPRLSSGA